MVLDRVLLVAAVAATLTFGRQPVAERTQSEQSRKPCRFRNTLHPGERWCKHPCER
jgi:hypothetical protein